MGSSPLTEETISPISHSAAVGPRQDISKQELSFRSLQDCARLANGVARTIVSLTRTPNALCLVRGTSSNLWYLLSYRPVGRNLSVSALTVHQRRAYDIDAMPRGVLCRAMYVGTKGQPLHHFHNEVQLGLGG